MIPPDDLFERARQAADLEAIAGIKLYRSGKRLRGPCPLCGASKGKRADGAFSADPATKTFKCWGCGEAGDAIDLEHRLRSSGSETKRDAAARLAGVSLDSSRPRPARQLVGRAPAAVVRPDADDFAPRLAAELWRGSAPARGTPAQVYLQARGIGGRPLAEALKHLRFHGAAYHSGGGRSAVRLPAMIGLVRAPAGPTGGVHVTSLAPDGAAKTHRTPAKRMWGPQARDGAAGGVWLTHPHAEGPLIVAEGIESALSAAVLQDRPCRVVAALALDRLQGGWIPDAYGRIDPTCVAADPERPAFTWPEPEGAPWGEVLVCVDRDMSGIEVKARKAGGGTWRRPIDGETRAKICASLACQAWRRTIPAGAGASAVRALAPAAGRDFNDELRAGGA